MSCSQIHKQSHPSPMSYNRGGIPPRENRVFEKSPSIG
ncbi:hypothetical protein RISK_001501 [Rhodopirellula islandica]|uniref:Uncharacterized protein n=1 Tax=Rhodopirellula islandica TaxID=595434 RepID=A0A0J1BIB5_RHOIS|nr:hypothetical protein RISK_001501 [Rhodopirellula islandica]